MDNFYGCLPDDRIDLDKRKDYLHSEIAGAFPVSWKEKTEYRRFPEFLQSSSYSCVMQSMAKALGINNFLEENKFVRLSAKDGYSRRAGKPELGSRITDVIKIAREGLTVESNMPSQDLQEDVMNDGNDRAASDIEIAKIYAAKNVIMIDDLSIDSIASVIAQGFGVSLWFHFGDNEWNQFIPEIKSDSAPYYHAVVGVDFTLKDGKKCIVIEDSSGYGKQNGQRLITEDFLKRCDVGYYFTDLKLNETRPSISAVKHYFATQMRYGSKGPEVAIMQLCLSTLKDDAGYLFPYDSTTGNMFGLTQNGIRRYQKLRGLTITGNVDTPTLAKLNIDFS